MFSKTAKPFLLICFSCLLLLLTGCVRYDLGLNFEGQHRGQIVQHIKLGKQITTLSETEANQLVTSLKTRAQKLEGDLKQISPEEIIVTIPFYNGKELTSKFNRFFNSNYGVGTKKDALDLLQINSAMSLKQSNWILAQYNQLHLTVDLRSLGIVSEQGNLIVTPGSLIDIQFALNTPWGAKTVINDDPLTPSYRQEGNQLIWQLKSGQINEIQSSFWMLSPLGIGAVAIALLMLGGFYLKYRHLPWQTQPQ